LQSSSDEDSDASGSDGNSMLSPRERRKLKKQKKQEALMKGKGKGKRMNREELEMSNIYDTDPNKLDMINNLNSTKLIAISSQFDLYPNEEVDLQQFVEIM